MSLARLVDAILNNENTVLPLSCYLEGQYGHEGLYIGVPAIINRAGIREILTLPLTESDQEKFDKSCNTLQEIIDTTVKPILEGKA